MSTLARLAVVLAAVPALHGCPLILPAPSARDPVPYTEADLSFLQAGATPRSEVVARLGPPPIERLGGRLVVYGAVQKTGVQGLLILVPVPVPIGGDARELPHHLFIRYSADDLVERYEVVRGEGCTTEQVCIRQSTAVDPSRAGGWYLDDRRIAGERAVIYQGGEAAATSRHAVPAADRCLVFIYQRPAWVPGPPVHFALDPLMTGRRAIARETFALHELPAGRRAVWAGIDSNPSWATREFDCGGGERRYLEIGLRIRLKSDEPFEVTLDLVPEEQARPQLEGRALLLPH